MAQTAQFVENKGQWDSSIKYTAMMSMGSFYLKKNGYRILLHNTKDLQAIGAHLHGNMAVKNGTDKTAMNRSSTSDSLILHSHAYEVTFEGASGNSNIVPEKILKTYNNYFIGKDSSKWASHCRIFNAVTYKNVYPNIDVRYYTDKGQLTYDLIVNPGGDVSKIALRFVGMDALSLKKGNLLIKNSVNDVTELAPSSYQLNETGNNNVNVQYSLSGNLLHFKVDNYSKNKTLVIDPTLVFCSFTGSKVDNWGYTATYDGDGNFYAGGIAFDNGFLVTNGAFQTSFGGGDNAEGIGPIDIAIMKFSANGKDNLFATYLGGAGSEQPHSMVVDNSNNLIIAGRTTSSNFPLYPSGNIYGPGGGFDIFITKISADGSNLLGSIKIGGTGADGVNIEPKDIGTVGQGAISIRRNYGDDARSEVMCDASNNIYLASCTQSANFPFTPNAFQKSFGGGTSGYAQDGVIIKASPDLLNSDMILSSYLGGEGDDAAFVVDISPATNNIYVGGSTTSSNFPGVGTGGQVINSTFQGGICDGFVSIINNGGSYNLINSTYIGTSGDDMLYGLKFDKTGYPYVMGITTGTWPIISASWSQSRGKQFIAKLDPSLKSYIYSTVFGAGAANPDISPIAFLVDRCENVYVSGWGGPFDGEQGEGYPNNGTTGLSTTPNNGLRSTPDVNGDFYFFVLNRDATSQLYGGFFGQVGGFNDHVDGGTSRYDKNGIIYQGICANCENYSGQFAPVPFPTSPGAYSSVNGASRPQNNAGCNMAAVKIAFELAGVGAGVQASIVGIPRDTSGCSPLTVNFIDTLAEGKSYVWIFGDGSRDTTLNPADSHTFNSIGTYHVLLISIDSSKCNIQDTSYTNIRVGDKKADLSFTYYKLPPCDSLKYEFVNTSVAPPGDLFKLSSFSWNFGDGTVISPGPDTIIHNFAASGTYFVQLNLNDTNYCNSPGQVTDTLRLAINVKAQFSVASGCAPYYANIINNSLAGQTFYWTFGDGTSSTDINPPPHLYATPGDYTIKLVVIDTATCNKIDSSSGTITSSPKPSASFTFSPVPPIANTAIVFVNTSSGASNYKWLFGDGDTLITIQADTSVQHIYNKTGTYNTCLIAYNQYGCSDTLCQPVQAITIPLIDVPNAFTPNGDGINDQIHVRGYGIDKLNWSIYNRWGELVFESLSQDAGWDGKYKGVLQPQEVYTYLLNVQFTDGTKYRKTGDITLLR